jgi:hypothetical protein
MDYNNFIDIYNLKNYDKQNIYNKSHDDIILNINYCKKDDFIKYEIIFGDIKINNNIQIYKNNNIYKSLFNLFTVFTVINLEKILNINKHEYNNINIYNSDYIFITQDIFILEKGNHIFYDCCGYKIIDVGLFLYLDIELSIILKKDILRIQSFYKQSFGLHDAISISSKYIKIKKIMLLNTNNIYRKSIKYNNIKLKYSSITNYQCNYNQFIISYNVFCNNLDNNDNIVTHLLTYIRKLYEDTLLFLIIYYDAL